MHQVYTRDLNLNWYDGVLAKIKSWFVTGSFVPPVYEGRLNQVFLELWFDMGHIYDLTSEVPHRDRDNIANFLQHADLDLVYGERIRCVVGQYRFIVVNTRMGNVVMYPVPEAPSGVRFVMCSSVMKSFDFEYVTRDRILEYFDSDSNLGTMIEVDHLLEITEL